MHGKVAPSIAPVPGTNNNSEISAWLKRDLLTCRKGVRVLFEPIATSAMLLHHELVRLAAPTMRTPGLT